MMKRLTSNVEWSLVDAPILAPPEINISSQQMQQAELELERANNAVAALPDDEDDE